ncbi:hypothetical protein ROZALSC1DRAFT_26041, partial [Rozella allomycis CSF55]
MIREEEFKNWLVATSKKLKDKVENLKDKDGDIIEFGLYCQWDKQDWIRKLGDDYGPSVYNKLHSTMAATIYTSRVAAYWNALRVLEIGAPSTVVNLPENVHILGNLGIGKS